jgi:hypothetical protein
MGTVLRGLHDSANQFSGHFLSPGFVYLYSLSLLSMQIGVGGIRRRQHRSFPSWGSGNNGWTTMGYSSPSPSMLQLPYGFWCPSWRHFLLEVLYCIRFRPVQWVGLSSVYVQLSPYRMVHRPFPGPTRGTAATLVGFSPLSTHRALRFSPPRCLNI